jgi:hypothetical protein
VVFDERLSAGSGLGSSNTASRRGCDRSCRSSAATSVSTRQRRSPDPPIPSPVGHPAPQPPDEGDEHQREGLLHLSRSTAPGREDGLRDPPSWTGDRSRRTIRISARRSPLALPHAEANGLALGFGAGLALHLVHDSWLLPPTWHLCQVEKFNHWSRESGQLAGVTNSAAWPGPFLDASPHARDPPPPAAGRRHLPIPTSSAAGGGKRPLRGAPAQVAAAGAVRVRELSSCENRRKTAARTRARSRGRPRTSWRGSRSSWRAITRSKRGPWHRRTIQRLFRRRRLKLPQGRPAHPALETPDRQHRRSTRGPT